MSTVISSSPFWTDVETAALRKLLGIAIAEDVGTGDLTSNSLVPPDVQASAVVVARQAGVVAGLPAGGVTLAECDRRLQWHGRIADGCHVEANTIVAEVRGPARSLLTSERILLNLIGRLSGVATLTRKYVQAVSGTQASILDTRKTIPGWRMLDKYAVRAGGGQNHRFGLFDGVLIKDNHLAFGAKQAGTDRFRPGEAVRYARSQNTRGTVIEVEVDTLEQLAEVLPAWPDIVLLDNMTCDQLREAVAMCRERAAQVRLEASGGVTLETVRAIAETGVDRISVGAITHSADNFDVGLDWL